MAFTYGCYNYDKNDVSPKLYDAEQISRIFDGIITEGIYAHVGNCFLVLPVSSIPMTVLVKSGRAWFNATWNYNDGDMYSGTHFDAAPPRPSFNKRIDALVIEVNRSTRTNKITWHMGTEAETPVKPTLTKNKNYSEHAICYITRYTTRDTITFDDIEMVVGTSETPYVTGVLESAVNGGELVRLGVASHITPSTQYLRSSETGTPYPVSGSTYMETTQHLSTTGPTPYSFTNDIITNNSVIEVFASKNMNYSSIEVSAENHRCVVTYPKVDSFVDMKVRIYIRND